MTKAALHFAVSCYISALKEHMERYPDMPVNTMLAGLGPKLFTLAQELGCNPRVMKALGLPLKHTPEQVLRAAMLVQRHTDIDLHPSDSL